MKTTKAAAFTLIELLAVMGVIVVLITLVTPVVIQVLNGTGITQSGEMVSDQFVLARQAAMTSNRPVQVRFYQLPSNYSGMQLFRVEENGATTPLSKLQTLRTNVIFAPDGTHSTILAPPSPTTLSVNGSQVLAAYNSAKCYYVGFQFLPDGSTDLDPTNNAVAQKGGWFVTLKQVNAPLTATNQLKNFYTIRIEPFNGQTRIFRP